MDWRWAVIDSLLLCRKKIVPFGIIEAAQRTEKKGQSCTVPINATWRDCEKNDLREWDSQSRLVIPQ